VSIPWVGSRVVASFRRHVQAACSCRQRSSLSLWILWEKESGGVRHVHILVVGQLMVLANVRTSVEWSARKRQSRCRGDSWLRLLKPRDCPLLNRKNSYLTDHYFQRSPTIAYILCTVLVQYSTVHIYVPLSSRMFSTTHDVCVSTYKLYGHYYEPVELYVRVSTYKLHGRCHKPVEFK
jgi:hypothetical protein